jgi:hypothetical protein
VEAKSVIEKISDYIVPIITTQNSNRKFSYVLCGRSRCINRNTTTISEIKQKKKARFKNCNYFSVLIVAKNDDMITDDLMKKILMSCRTKIILYYKTYKA